MKTPRPLTRAEDSVPSPSSDPLKRRVWQLAIPAIGENLMLTGLMMVDTLMIARYGPVALAASAMAGVIVWRGHMTFGSIDRGTMAVAARCAGSGDMNRLARSVAQSILVAIFIGTLMGVACWIGAAHFLSWMKAEVDVIEAGTPYLMIIGLASVPRMLFSVASASLRATGDTRSPMWITLWMNVLNILGNFPLIYGIPPVPALGFSGWEGLGLTGSGISTALALTFAAGVGCWLALSGKAMYRVEWHHFKPDWSILRTLLRISFPSLVEETLISVGFLIFFRFIAVLGTTALAAHAISTRIEALSFMAGVGFAIAAATLVGQALGKKDLNLARQAFKISTKYCVILMSFVAVVLIIFAEFIVGKFAPDNPEIREIAAILLVIAALEQPLMAISMTLGGGLRGAGDTVTPMIASLICNIGIRVGASYYFAFVLGFGIYGIYIGTVIDWSVRAILLYWFYRWERWSRIRI